MVDVVGRGTVLAGRYRVLQPLASDLEGSPAWQATDQILDRSVRVCILVSGNVPQALDAARRAALVSDPRLVRVLDVGSHEGVSYVVTEEVRGPSLADLLARGPLTGDQARAIVGEVAAALEIARRHFTRAETDWLESQSPGSHPHESCPPGTSAAAADRGDAACAPRDLAFLRLWCAKEAVLKAHGRGLAFGLDRLAFEERGGALVLVAADPALGDPAAWTLHEFVPHPGYRAALAWRPA